MFRTVLSCVLALVVAVIVGVLLFRTIKQETARSGSAAAGVLTNVGASKDPVKAFTTTELLADYLLAGAAGKRSEADRIASSPGAVTVDSGTHVVVLGYSGPGQAQVKILDGPRKGEILYVSYMLVQENSR